MNTLNKLFTRPDADRGHFEQHGILGKWIKDRVISPTRILLLAALLTVAALGIRNKIESTAHESADHRPTPELAGASTSGPGSGADGSIEVIRSKSYEIKKNDTPWMFVADFLEEAPTSVRVLEATDWLVNEKGLNPYILPIGDVFFLYLLGDGSLDWEIGTRDQIDSTDH